MAVAEGSALLVVDVQNDFCPGGALPVIEGDLVVPKLNDYLQLFQEHRRPIVASRDWHPPETTHFRSRGGPWPVHCVQGTRGAAFHPDLSLPSQTTIISKGMGATDDAYSAFQARDERGLGLTELLRALGVRELFIGGLTLDYCVRSSALDALLERFRATVLLDATRAVNVRPHDGEQAIVDLVRAGVALAVIERLR